MRSHHSVALLARSELDRQAYGGLLTRIGAKLALIASTDDASRTALSALGATAVVVVADDADVHAVSQIQALRGDLPALRYVVICSRGAAGLWEGVADAIVPRQSDVEHLRAALEPLPDGLASRSTDHAGTLRERYKELSKTEAELLPLLASGLTLRDAAQTLAISYKTADNSRTRLFRKLGLRDRVQLARFAIREGIISP